MSQITVDVPDCPKVAPMVAGIPSWVVGWGLAATVAIVIVAIVSIAVVRYKHHEEETTRQGMRERYALDRAKVLKRCLTCGADYPKENAA